MQQDPRAFTDSPSFAYGDEANGCMINGPLGGQCIFQVPVSPAFGDPAGMIVPQLRSTLSGFEFQPSKVFPRNFIIFDEFQPSKVFPRNFIIFDHNDDKGCIMYHPSLANKFNSTNINTFLSYGEAGCRSSGRCNDNLEEQSSSFKEDTREIDALMSSDEGSDEDYTVSTGRTPDPLESGPLDSSSMPRFKKMKYPSEKSSVLHGCMENVSHESMRKVVIILRGIIPGADQLDTPAVLEEAVRYLKFLKVEAKKLGVEYSDN